MTNPNGIDFFEFWIDKYVPWECDDLKMAEAFAKQLLVDAAANGFTVEDMNLQGYDIVKYMLESMNAKPPGRYDKVLLI